MIWKLSFKRNTLNISTLYHIFPKALLFFFKLNIFILYVAAEGHVEVKVLKSFLNEIIFEFQLPYNFLYFSNNVELNMKQHMLHIGTEIMSSNTQNKTLKKKITYRKT